jgi:dephospho-CoA kinase
MQIIGLTGTLGAGKGTIVDYLIENHHFKHYSVRQFLTDEIIKRKLAVNRDSMVLVANELRAKHNPAYIIEELYRQALSGGGNCIIESIRTPGEVESLRSKEHFTLFAVDADPGIRYQRILARNSETDRVSFEEFLANEKREFNSTDPNKQNLSFCIASADYVFINEGSIDALRKQVELKLIELQLI